LLIAGSALALHLAQVQQAGTKRTDLQRHDLSAPWPSERPARSLIRPARSLAPAGATTP
jgi:hypothetical protein